MACNLSFITFEYWNIPRKRSCAPWTSLKLSPKSSSNWNFSSQTSNSNPPSFPALIFPPGLDLICAFYGCLYLGAIPVTIRPPHPQNLITTLPTVRMIVDVSKSGIVLSIQSIIKLLKSREAAASIDPKSWPLILDIDDNPKRKLTGKVLDAAWDLHS